MFERSEFLHPIKTSAERRSCCSVERFPPNDLSPRVTTIFEPLEGVHRMRIGPVFFNRGWSIDAYLEHPSIQISAEHYRSAAEFKP